MTPVTSACLRNTDRSALRSSAAHRRSARRRAGAAPGTASRGGAGLLRKRESSDRPRQVLSGEARWRPARLGGPARCPRRLARFETSRAFRWPPELRSLCATRSTLADRSRADHRRDRGDRALQCCGVVALRNLGNALTNASIALAPCAKRESRMDSIHDHTPPLSPTNL
jgi:hypothetical protein